MRLLILTALCLAPGLRAEESGTAAMPNILWITVEDMSPRLGCYGDRTVPTPNVDRLASEGVRYTRAFGTYGVCAPNRHTLILGMYPSSTGAMAMRTWKRTASLAMVKDPELLAIPVYEATPPPQAKCFTEYLRAAGYYCSNNVKTDYQFRDPITAWDESSNTAHWRNRPTKDTPFFSVFNFTVTHESGTFKQRSPIVVDPAKVTLPPYYPDTPIVRRDVARHYDNIAAMDEQIGKVLRELEEDGLRKNTVVFYFSDHGDGLPRMKRWVYDSGIQVPFIVRHPDGRGAGTANGDLVSFVDFAPTVLSLVGLPIPKVMEGSAFLGAKKAAPRKYIYALRDRMDPAAERVRAVRDERFKYVRNYRPDLPYIGFIPYRDQAGIMQEIHRLTKEDALGPQQWQFTGKKKPLEELYDTKADPHEIRNLASIPRYAEKLAELREAHEAWRAKYGDLGDLKETDLVKKLWPPEGKQPTTSDPKVRVDGSKVEVSCASSGASIAYRIGGQGRWLLYSGPIEAKAGATVEAQAIRLGWKKSGIVAAKVE